MAAAQVQRRAARAKVALPLLARPLSDGLNLGEHLMAGGAATAVAVCSVHPLDTLKTVQQSAAAASGSGPLRAFFGLVRRGPSSVYAGVGSALGSQVPAGAIKFAAYEALIGTANRHFSRVPQPLRDFGCAALAFVACSVVLMPGEVIKQRLQAGMHKSAGDAVRAALRDGGIRGLYAGYGSLLVRDVPYTALEYGSYAAFKRGARAVARRKKLRPAEEWTCGGLAGGFTGLVTTPLDVAKTRLVVAGAQYKGIADVLRKTAVKEGIPGLFKGSSARVAWLVPFTAIFFGIHEASKRALLDRKRVHVAGAPKQNAHPRND